MIPTFRSVVAIATVAGRTTLTLLAILVVLWALSAGSAERVDPPTSRAEAVAEHETTLRIPEGELTKNLKVLDPSGRVLVTLNYFQHGDLVVSTGDSFSAHAGLWMGHDGSSESVVQVGSWQSRLQSRLNEMPKAMMTLSEPKSVEGDGPAPTAGDVNVP